MSAREELRRAPARDLSGLKIKEQIMNRDKMVLGVFHDHATAQNCIDSLYAHGYSADDINVLMSEHTRITHFTKSDDHEREHTDNLGLEGAGVGGAIGTAVGASLAALAAVGTSLVIPGLNLVMAGPLAAALAGGGAGAITGGLIGGLAGLGFSAENAEVYHSALREGGTIVGVTLMHQNDDHEQSEVETVKEIMKSFNGEQIHTCRC